MPDKMCGLYEKFKIERTDGKSAPGEKHHACQYFVLDLVHDRFALTAILAYALACEREFPILAADLYKTLDSKDIPAWPPPHQEKPHVLDTLDAFDEKGGGLTVRLFNCLKHGWPRKFGGPFTVGDAAGKSDKELLAMKNFGRVSLAELRLAIGIYLQPGVKDAGKAEGKTTREERTSSHSYSSSCGCPGCQFMWAAERGYEKFGPAPIIDTFEPKLGDLGRDCDDPLSPVRVYTGDGRWHPYFEIMPRMQKTKQPGTPEL